MIRPVLQFPDRRLKTPAVPMGRVGPAARRLAADLRDTARAHPGTVGLAATQLGVMWRMVWFDCTGHRHVPDPLGETWLVDPVARPAGVTETAREGCLSLPEVTANVSRPTAIEVRALDLDGRPVRLEVEGFEARVILHEIDHLDGVLILDRVSSLARDLFPRRSGRRVTRSAALVERAATLARVAHAGRTRGEEPFAAHLAEVLAHVEAAGVAEGVARAACWLHALPAAAGIPPDELRPEFGDEVADLVARMAAAATDDGEDAPARAERLVAVLRAP